MSLTTALALAAALNAAQPANTASTEVAVELGNTRVYRVEQTVRLSEIPEDAGQVRWWVSIPDNERYQEILDFSVVNAPGTWRVERDANRGNRFLYIEVDQPKATELETVIEFTLRREPVLIDVDPEQVGPITNVHRRMYAEELRRDVPYMGGDDKIAELAFEVCGEEKNPALQARALLNYVAEYADHYSKDPTKPHCGIGTAEDCLTNAGGCCTDLHSLFISLARARGIPTRLQMGYRLNPKNADKSYDPGYRCWVEYFLPGYGWISADIVEADATGGQGPERWFTGLTEWRLWLNEGREFQLRPEQASSRVNTMIIGHAEIDGKVARVLPDEAQGLAAQHSRKVRFTELR